MSKRFFQVLDEMNLHDAEHKTAFVGVCNQQIYAQASKQGGQITMGVPHDVFSRMIDGKAVAILVVVDKKEYEKRTK